MSADILRRAELAIRAEWSGERGSGWDRVQAFHLAVADSLRTAGADLWAHGPLCCANGCTECDDLLWMPHVRHALAVARAYLGEPSGGDA